RRPNLLFLDIWLQGSRLDGLQLLDSVKEQHPEMPVVMISGHGNIETAVAAIKRGAYDFIEKPFKADRLVLVADRALATSRRDPPAVRSGRPSAADQRVSATGGEARANKQPDPDRRPLGRRQGACGTPPAFAVEPRRRSLRGDQCGGDHARTHGNRTFRRRAIQ